MEDRGIQVADATVGLVVRWQTLYPMNPEEKQGHGSVDSFLNASIFLTQTQTQYIRTYHTGWARA